MSTATSLLEIRGLRVEFDSPHGPLTALAGVDLSLGAGECLGIVGESGSGKSQLLLSILGLSPRRARLAGSICYRGARLLGGPPQVLNRIRGRRIAMVFQDPMTALNPCLRIGEQIAEVARVHLGATHRDAARRALSMLEAVQVSDPPQRARQYPHELSGGMRQRVMLAMALIGEPEILLADEPTTALDVTIQAQILSLLRRLRAERGVSLLLVTHDLGVIAEIADRVAVMYAGRVLEQASVGTMFSHPRHPYTEALQRCLPRLDQPPPERLPSIRGRPPELYALPPGCPFAPRCIYRMPVCDTEDPPLSPAGPAGAEAAGHLKACWYEGGLGRLAAQPT